jgi:hypothetical protein
MRPTAALVLLRMEERNVAVGLCEAGSECEVGVGSVKLRWQAPPGRVRATWTPELPNAWRHFMQGETVLDDPVARELTLPAVATNTRAVSVDWGGGKRTEVPVVVQAGEETIADVR